MQVAIVLLIQDDVVRRCHKTDDWQTDLMHRPILLLELHLDARLHQSPLEWLEQDCEREEVSLSMDHASSVLFQLLLVVVEDLDVSGWVSVPLAHDEVKSLIVERKEHLGQIQHWDVLAVSDPQSDRNPHHIEIDRHDTKVDDTGQELDNISIDMVVDWHPQNDPLVCLQVNKGVMIHHLVCLEHSIQNDLCGVGLDLQML